MPRYKTSDGHFGIYPTVVLQDLHTGARAEIALRGATLLSLKLPTPHQTVDVISGYRTPEEFASLSGARSAILAPFSNRIDGGCYHFDGVDYALDDLDAQGNAKHGMVMAAQWSVRSVVADDHNATVWLSTDVLQTEQFAGYPFNVVVEARFCLSRDGLELTLTATNSGSIDAPFACGWHPYLSTPAGHLDRCQLSIPHRSIIAVDDRMIPLSGEQAYGSLNDTPDDFSSKPKAIGALKLDQCYLSPPLHDSEWWPSRLYDPVADLNLELRQQRGVVHVYTSDSLPSRQREAVALEPNEFMPNAFNRPELRDQIRLPAGQRRTFRSALSVHSSHWLPKV